MDSTVITINDPVKLPAPIIVTWKEHDPENPLTWSHLKRGSIAWTTALATFAVALSSSAYSGAVMDFMVNFTPDTTLITLGLSLYILGFALGPLLWAPLSETYGRRLIFIFSYTPYVIWSAAIIGSPNITALLIMRFLEGTFGSAMLVNAGGIMADLYTARERGMAIAIFAAAVFMAPVAGPILGGYLGQYLGWRWLFGILAIINVVMWLLDLFLCPETYAPVLLAWRAEALAKTATEGQVFLTQYQAIFGKQTLAVRLKNAMTRPWQLLLFEPIVTLFSIWMAIVYGTLYLCFEAFPYVFQLERGWTMGQGGLAFLGIGIGMAIGVAANVLYYDPKYIQLSDEAAARKETLSPEARLPMACLGGVLAPISLIALAWTASPTSVHWVVPIVVSAPFGTGLVFTFLAATNYLVDTYLVFAASVLAGSGVLRSLFGFAFPLFAIDMYDRLGVNWATMLVAFLSLACTPIPFAFYIYGERIRGSSKTTQAAAKMMMGMMHKPVPPPSKQNSVQPTTLQRTTTDSAQDISAHEVPGKQPSLPPKGLERRAVGEDLEMWRSGDLEIASMEALAKVDIV